MNNRGWGREPSWEYDERFEELDTDYEHLHGIELDNGYRPKRFVSDELRFTGIDMSSANSRARQRRSKNVYDEDTDSQEDHTDDANPPGELQVMLRSKEDDLVERALERIARARALGKTNVKLSQAEIDALERLDQKQQRPTAPPPLPKPVPAPKSKKAVTTRPKVAERKKSKGDKSASNSPKVKAIEAARGSRGRSSVGSRESALVPYPVLPEQGQGPPTGMYDSEGYYMPAPVRPSGSSVPGSRTASSHSLRQQHSNTPPIPPALQQYYQGRYYSNPDVQYTQYQARPSSNSSRASRPDPSDPDWEPRARSTSNLVSYPVDQLPYQTQTARAPRFDPSDPRFASPARRVHSGPAAVHASQQAYRRTSVPDATDTSTTTDEDDDEGVQVEVEEDSDGEYQVQTRSLTVADPRRARGGSATQTRAGRRR